MKNKFDKIILNELRYNRCSILLDDIEKNYLNERINSILENNNQIALGEISEIIENIHINSEIRSFSVDHIPFISIDILDRIKKKLNEEPGRNLHSTETNPISHEKIIGHKLETSICANTGKNIVTWFVKKERKVKYFASEAEAKLFVQNMRLV